MVILDDVKEIIDEQIKLLKNPTIQNVENAVINLQTASKMLGERMDFIKKTDERLEESMKPKEDVKSWYGYAIDKLGNLIYTTFNKKRLD